MRANWTPLKASVVTVLVCAGVVALVLIAGVVPISGKRNTPDNPGENHGEDHGEHEKEEDHIRLTPEAMQEYGIEVVVAGSEKIRRSLRVSGEIGFNKDRVAHIVPRAPGIVVKVYKSLGDRVAQGDVLAVLESRVLADAKSGYLSALQRADLTKANHARIEKLWKEKIAPEKSYLKARQQLAETQIEVRAAEQKLHALGLSQKTVDSLPKQSDVSLTHLEMKAPFEGEITQKHITLGEAMKEDSSAFTIADLSTVWVNLTIYSADLTRVRVGQKVSLEATGIEDRSTAKIIYLGPVVGEATRTALARLVLPNPDVKWRPGLFITAFVRLDETDDVPVAVLNEAIQTVEGQEMVFVEEEGAFEARPVRVGKRNGMLSEITAGLNPGERYVAQGSFTLKAEMMKEAFGNGHSH